MFSDICKVNLFSKSSHDEDELQKTKTQAQICICFCTCEQPQFSDTQNSTLALRQCFSGIMLRMKTVYRSCLQDVRDICKTDYIL